MILDEPTNGLDPQGIQEIRQLLLRLNDAGTTIFLSSHLLAEVAQTVDDVVILKEGQLISHAPLTELTTQTTSVVVVRSPDATRLCRLLAARGLTATFSAPDGVSVIDATPEDVGRVVAAAGVVIYEMRLQQSNLEEIFFSLTETEGSST